MTHPRQLSLDELHVEERITYTPKQRMEMQRIRGVMDMLNHTSLLISLRGKPLDDVIAAWHEANAPKGTQPHD